MTLCRFVHNYTFELEPFLFVTKFIFSFSFFTQKGKTVT